MFTPERFGAAEWFHWFGVDVGQEPKFPKEITLFWNQPDPIDRTQLVSATHLPPVLCPQFIGGQPYNLRLLGQIVQHPQNGGHASKYTSQTSALDQHQDTPAGSACWLVMKKDVGARNKPYAAQVDWLQRLPGSYEATTSAIHLATVILTRHVITGNRHLGNHEGQEGFLSFGRCQEIVHDGAFGDPLDIGGFASDGLRIDSSFTDLYGCVVALRKF